jgi:hypothetical protein
MEGPRGVELSLIQIPKGPIQFNVALIKAGPTILFSNFSAGYATRFD